MRDRPPEAAAPLRIGISACLLGEKVRYDGGHKKDAYINDILSRFVQFVPVCPEMDIGLGVPRPAIRLEKRDGAVRLIEPGSGADLTDQMDRYAARRVRGLGRDDLCGYILKKNSPSCGMERVRVHAGKRGGVARGGRGLFADALIRALPLLPVEEEGRLQDALLRENFIERVFAYRRLKDLFAGRWTVGELVRFHTGEKLLLLAHGPKSYRALGRLVAGAKGRLRRELEEDYMTQYMRAMEKHATVSRHVNVLQHMAGHLRSHLTPDERAELSGVIADFRAQLVPLLVPLTLFRHHVRRFDIAYLAGQRYLDPHPKELMLRNHT